MNWQNKDLFSELKSRQLEGKIYMWRLTQKELDREERYYIQSEGGLDLDQVRSVTSEDLSLELWVDKGQKVGSFSTPLFRSRALAEQIEKAQARAKLSTEEKWTFSAKELQPVEVSQKTSFKKIYDPIKKNLKEATQIISKDFEKSILETENDYKNSKFNSAELFVSRDQTTRFISSEALASEEPLSWAEEASKIYSEVCFSSRDSQGEENEYLIYKMGAHPEEINFKELCQTSASHSKALLEAKPAPPSGQYPVVVDSEVISVLLWDILAQLKLDRKYHSMPFIEKGSELFKNFNGDTFSLTLDPHMDYGFGSCHYSDEGLFQERMKLIENNKVLFNLVSDQMSQYLKEAPTITKANLVLETQGRSYEELLKSDQSVIEILQFSGLFTNWQDLTFASEIRLGRVIEPSGKSYYFKGGSLSGSIKENFKEIRFSKEQTFENINELSMSDCPLSAYKGPKWARLSGVSVSS